MPVIDEHNRTVKAYIFDYHDDGRYEKGIAIVGSPNTQLVNAARIF